MIPIRPPYEPATTDANGIARYATKDYEDRAVRIVANGRLGVGATWWNQNSGPTAGPPYRPGLVTR